MRKKMKTIVAGSSGAGKTVGKAESKYVIRKFPIDMENSLIIKSNDRLINIKLHLKGDKPREIGTITKSTRTIEMRRTQSKHLFRKGNAYGFNDYVLRNSQTFDWIRLSDDLGNHWKIPKAFIIENGSFLHFKQVGFERQRFLSLEQLEPYRVHENENRRF
jgi:hypothetical protein